MSISLFEAPDLLWRKYFIQEGLPVVFVSITEETGIQLLALGDSFGRVPS
jgi:hypothetical protein